MTTMWPCNGDSAEQGGVEPTVVPVHPTFSHGGPCNGDSAARARVTPGEQVDRQQTDVVYPSTFGQCPNDGENRAYENPGGISFRALIAEDFRALRNFDCDAANPASQVGGWHALKAHAH